jgi:hypothetical protein
MWLWPAAQVARAWERDTLTIGDWLEAFRYKAPTPLAFEQSDRVFI